MIVTFVVGDVSLFSTYRYFIETVFNKVVINANKSNDYIVFHQPKMAIISKNDADYFLNDKSPGAILDELPAIYVY